MARNKSYNAAWRMKHKLMQVVMERDDDRNLSGFIEVDDAYLGGERSGGKRGRGADAKTPCVAAMITTSGAIALRVTRQRLQVLKNGDNVRYWQGHGRSLLFCFWSN